MPKYQRMSGRAGWMSGRARKLVVGGAAVVLAGGAFAISTGISSAGENCAGLDQALRNNLDFIAGQRAAPDALSLDRIANRQAVVDLIEQRRAAAGCTDRIEAAAPATGAPAHPTEKAPPAAEDKAAEDEAAEDEAAEDQKADDPEQGSDESDEQGGERVCVGSTVTLSGEGGAPAASSGTYPAGTRLRITNLDNERSTTVEVTGPSGSCALLNNAAFEQVREPGKFVIRRAVIERIG